MHLNFSLLCGFGRGSNRAMLFPEEIRCLVQLVMVSVLLLGHPVASSSTPSSTAPAILEGERMHPVKGAVGMVATSHYLATNSALEVLKKGGNGIDAAVTAGFTLAVTQPRSGNIGGGGFMLISSERTGEIVAIDYREKAPARATADAFVDQDGNIDKSATRYSHRSSGVPGTVAGLGLALELYGTISLQEAMAPAIRFAEEGFVVTPRLSQGLKSRKKSLTRWESSRRIFYKDDGSDYEPGDLFVQKDLAATLKRIAHNGTREFYEGETAKLLVAEMERHGGFISMEDMKQYSAKLRKPVHGTYRGYDIFSMPPPSSGGVHVVQMLNILEGYTISQSGHNSAQTIHLMVEAMKRAYSDRSRYLGDDDFVAVPLRGLISKEYGRTLRSEINVSKATPSNVILPGNPIPYESSETTHFSVVDSYGNAVSNTYTINFSFGSGIVVAGAGFLLNNEMDDFSILPGVPNAYGLTGGSQNRIEPGKRMLSSMSPTIVKKGSKNFLVTGTPGGSRIISTTLQVIMNVIDHGLNIQSAVTAPRVHHQWLPDQLRIEEGISPDTIEKLEQMGHRVIRKPAMGGSQSILVIDGEIYGGADPRRSTSSAAGL